jgi:integrase
MATKLTDTTVKRLPAPAEGYEITWDSQVAGFGARITAGGARAFTLDYRTRVGRKRRFTIGTFPNWSTGAARDEARRLKTLIDRGGDPLGEIKAGRAAPTVADLCDRFIAEHLPRKRPSTQKSYARQIAADIRPALGPLKVAEVAYSDIDRLHRKITARGAPYRANRVIATLSKMLSLAVRWHWRTDNPCKSIERNDEHKRRRYLSAVELARLTVALASAKDQQSADIIRLLLLTGARRGETLQARWADIDLASKVWRKPAASTKQNALHEIPLSAAACSLLFGLRQRSPPSAEWVFAAAGGHRKDIKDSWASICATAGIKGARVHDLRHTYASVLASAGLSLPIIGQLLGHTTPTTTARYAHLFDDPLRAAAERAGAIITGAESAEIVPLPDRRRG